MECPHRFDGSLFRGRYKAMVVEAERYLLELVRYIHVNPVRAGLVGRVEKYRWRSYRAYRSGSQQCAWLDRSFVLSLLGSKEFIDRLKAKFRNLRDHPEIPESKVLSPRIDSIKMAVCAAYETDLSDLLWSRRGTTNEARNVAIYLCRRLSGETLARIGKEFHLDNYGSVSSVVSRMKKTLTHDVRLRKRVDGVEREGSKLDLTLILILLIS